MNYGRALKIIRSIKDISQQDFASQTGLSKSLISRIESGERTLSPENIQIISETFNIPPDLIKLLAYERRDNSTLPEKKTIQMAKMLAEILNDYNEK